MQAMATQTCPFCYSPLPMPALLPGTQFNCQKCGQRLVVREASPANGDDFFVYLGPPSRKKSGRRSNSTWRPESYLGLGIILGCVVGYLSAHYFPLWGGLFMLGEPGSRARELLVPGHVLLYAVVFGIFAIGLWYMKQNHRKGKR
jgi:hypothetical protein